MVTAEKGFGLKTDMLVETIPTCPPRPDDAHKGTFGTVIVVGGCATMIGAPALCASACLRGGVGRVKIAAAADVLPFILGIEPGATGIQLWRGDADSPEDSDPVLAAQKIRKADPDAKSVLAIGPGLGTDKYLLDMVLALTSFPQPVVLDADALNLLASSRQSLEKSAYPRLLTPHPGEYARLAAALNLPEAGHTDTQRVAAAQRLAEVHHALVILKGHRTVVADECRGYINQTGNAALATAGSGDVLTGLIASLLAQNMSAWEAAVLGVYLHGLAGDLWARQHGRRGLKAVDLANLLPDTMQTHDAFQNPTTMRKP